MPVTRPPDYPPEAAALVDSFSRCCEGSDMMHVLDASANFFLMALHSTGKAKGLSLERVQENAREMCDKIIADIADQWDRKPEPTDIAVKQN